MNRESKFCGASIYTRSIPGETYVCSLVAGHRGAHESADGAIWTQPEAEEASVALCERCGGPVRTDAGWSTVRPGEAKRRWHHAVADCPALSLAALEGKP